LSPWFGAAESQLREAARLDGPDKARAQGNNVLAGPIARETAQCEAGQKLRDVR
jgi:hypothetical protein